MSFSPVKRMQYFDGLFLKEDEFKLDQSYHTRMRQLHNGYLHSWGIVTGLDVTKTGLSQVTVAEGMALNRVSNLQGEIISQEIILQSGHPDNPLDLNQPGYNAGDSIYITISYEDQDVDVVPDKGGTTPIHVWEKAALSHSKTKPANPNEQIILARVVLKAGKEIDAIYEVDIDGTTSLRKYSGMSGRSVETQQVTLTIENELVNLATLSGKKFGPLNGLEVTSQQTNFTGPLTITGRVGIGTAGVPTTDVLEVNGSVKATSYAGNGALLTNISAANITGTIADGLIASTIARDAEVDAKFNTTNGHDHDGVNSKKIVSGAQGWLKLPCFLKKYGPITGVTNQEFTNDKHFSRCNEVPTSTSNTFNTGILEIPIPPGSTKITSITIAIYALATSRQGTPSLVINLYKSGYEGNAVIRNDISILNGGFQQLVCNPNTSSKEVFATPTAAGTDLSAEYNTLTLYVTTLFAWELYLVAAQFE